MLDKANRDLVAFRLNPEYPLDVLFNLVTTIDHIWDWASKDDTLSDEKREAARTLRNTNPDVAVIKSLSVGAKHLVLDRTSAAKTEVAEAGWGNMPWGTGPWGGGTIYRVEVDGTMRDVADVAADALTAWRDTLA